jgi:hypothetical protein
VDVAQRRRVELRVAGWLFFVFMAGSAATVVVIVTSNLIFGFPWTLAENAVCLVVAAGAGFFAYRAWLLLRDRPAPLEVPARVRRRAVLRYAGVLVFQVAVFALVCALAQVIHPAGGDVYDLVVLVLAGWVSGEAGRPFRAPAESS